MIASDFLSIRDFSPEQIVHLLELARQVKTFPAAYEQALKGKTLALIFEKPLRFRSSGRGKGKGASPSGKRLEQGYSLGRQWH